MSDIIPAYDTSLFSWYWLPSLFYSIYQRSCGLDGFSPSYTVSPLAGRCALLLTLPRWSNTERLIALTRGDCERTQPSRRLFSETGS